MSADNKAILKRAMEAFNHAETREEYLKLYDTNCVLHGYQDVAPGLDGIRQFYEQFWAAFPDVQLKAEDMMAEGDRVTCRFSFTATHQGPLMGIPATGRCVSVNGITILRFADGRCIERWSQTDFLGMLQQLGALPAPA